jgi:hypothetical protein
MPTWADFCLRKIASEHIDLQEQIHVARLAFYLLDLLLMRKTICGKFAPLFFGLLIYLLFAN